MLSIKVLSSHVEETNFNKDGKSYYFRNQYGAVNLYSKDGRQHDFSREVKIPLDKDQPPYAPGEYMLSPASLYVNKYQQLAIGRIQLVPRSSLSKAA